MPKRRYTDPETGVVTEVEFTEEQDAHLEIGRRFVHWTSPEVPEPAIDPDGTLVQREDAPPKPSAISGE